MLINLKTSEKKFENKNRLEKIICFLLSMMMLGSFGAYAQAAKTLKFSGYTWNVRDYEGMPGPNKFHADNVWVDDNGFLHLKIAKRNGVWTSAELYTTELLSFGTYQFKILGRPDRLDKNVVFGLFNYAAPSGTNEIDIEFARWGNDSYPNLNWTIWPAQMLNGNHAPKYPTTVVGSDGHVRDAKTSEMKLASDQSTHIFTWSAQSIMYEAHNGFVDFNDHKTPFSTWTFAPSDSAQRIPQKPLVVDINLWMFEGKAPAGDQAVEVVVTEFKLFKGQVPVNEGNSKADTIPTTSLSNSGIKLFSPKNGERLSEYYKDQPKDPVDCRVWKEGDVYAIGDKVSFNNTVYTSRQNHRAWRVLKSWSPDIASQLWSKGGLCTKEDAIPSEISKEPCKAWDPEQSYMIGEVVSYDKGHYVALLSHKSLRSEWTPSTTLTTWQKVDACVQPVSKKKEWSPVIEGQRPTVEEMRISWYGASKKCKTGTEEECNVFYSKKKKYPVPHDVRTEGKGTADDPITLAADGRPFPVGTLIYIPQYKKYFVFEDKCEGCVGENYIELFMGPTKNAGDEVGLLKCSIEESTQPVNLDKPKTKIMINPEKNLEVDQTPMFTSKTCKGKPIETVLPNCDGAPPVVNPPQGDGGSVGNGGGGGDGGSSGGTIGTGNYAAAKKLCLDEVNRHRATLGRSALVWDTELEALADRSAAYDLSHGTHHALNGIEGWNIRENYGWAMGKTVENFIKESIQNMWDEGPGDDFQKHGHFLNMRDADSKMGCGVAVSDRGMGMTHLFK